MSIFDTGYRSMKELNRTMKNLNSYFDDNNMGWVSWNYNSFPNSEISSDGKTSTISIEFPGFNKEDITITLENNDTNRYLIIKGNISDKNKSMQRYKNMDTTCKFVIDSALTSKDITTTFENGLLKIVLKYVASNISKSENIPIS